MLVHTEASFTQKIKILRAGKDKFAVLKKISFNGTLGKTSYLTIQIELNGYPLPVGYHKITISVNNSVFHAWIQIRPGDLGGVAECRFPVPLGSHEVSVSCAGFPSSSFSLSRSLPRNIKGIQRAENIYKKALARYRYDSSPSAMMSLYDDLSRLSLTTAGYGCFKKSYKWCLSEIKFGEKLEKRGGAAKRLDKSVFRNVFFFQGDLKNMLWVYRKDIEESEMRLRIALSKHHLPYSIEARWLYPELIRRWITLGGSSAGARQLNDRFIKVWIDMGLNMKEKHFFELPVCLGPARGGKSK
jgi:hypothetical protein